MSIAFDKRDYRNILEDESPKEEGSTSEDEVVVERTQSNPYRKVMTTETHQRWEIIIDYCRTNALPLFDKCTATEFGDFLHRYYPALE